MRGTERAFAVVLAALVLMGCSVHTQSALTNQTTDALLLKLAFVAGSTLHYGLGVTNDGVTGAGDGAEPFSRETTADETDRVVSVAQNGDADLDVVVNSLGAMPLPVTGPSRTMRMTVAPDGRLVAGSLKAGLPASSSTVPVFNTQSMVDLPDHPVRPGATWTQTVTAEAYGLPSVLRYGTLSRFDRVEVVGSTRAAVVVTTARFDLRGVTSPSPTPSGQSAMKFSGPADVTATYWLDLAAHQLIKTDWRANVDSTLTVDAPAFARLTLQVAAVRSRAAVM